MTIIRTENLSRRFDAVTAVDGLTLEVGAGEVFGLVGPDGAGKTTTMRLLTAVLELSGGAASVCGYDVATQAEEIKGHIGYMSQQFGLYPDLTVMENILFYADIYGVPRSEMPARIERLLEFSNLAAFRKRLSGNLSGGMKQKLGLACALVHTPRVLFLDEPTNGVDPVSRRDFWRILYRLLREGVTIFMSTAYLDEAERCHRLALMHKGRLLATGSPDEVKRKMIGQIVEVRCADPRKAAAILRERMGDAPVGLFGDRMHVSCREAAPAMGDIRRALAQVGLEADARQIEPSLEDVFISVVAGSEKGQGGGDSAGRRVFQTTKKEPAPAGESVPTFERAVVVRGLVKRFGKFVAVDGVSFEVNRGEIFGFLGPNGAGKSTTIRMLCGILAPTAGGGSVAGFDIATQSELIKQHIGYMSQKFSLYEDLTVEENIDFYAGVYRIEKSRRAERKDWAIRMAGLVEQRRSRTGALSGGWKQRLALGCAILHEPPVIFLDEPTSGVDPISRRRFWDLIHELSARGVTVFVTTHYMDEAEYCDRLGLIYRGQLIAIGSPGELKTRHVTRTSLEDVFVSLIEEHDRGMGADRRNQS